jgi:hypothetical protein
VPFTSSPIHVLTAMQNISENNLERFGLVKRLRVGSSVDPDELVELVKVTARSNENWVIIKREQIREHIRYLCHHLLLPDSIVHVTWHCNAGLLGADSSTVVEAHDAVTYIARYQNRPVHASPTASGASQRKKQTGVTSCIVAHDPNRPPTPALDVMVVDGALATGSCGAPYDLYDGTVAAFHAESANEEAFVGHSGPYTSRRMVSHGYILCRLTSFMAAYAADVQPALQAAP